ncbi:hypothetical protein [Streptomyces sp. NPDC001927]
MDLVLRGFDRGFDWLRTDLSQGAGAGDTPFRDEHGGVVGLRFGQRPGAEEGAFEQGTWLPSPGEIPPWGADHLVEYERMNNSVFAASAADLTIERIRALAARLDQVESLTDSRRENDLALRHSYQHQPVTA